MGRLTRAIGSLLVAIVVTTIHAQSLAPPPAWPLPAESAGLDAIVRTLISAFDHADVVAIGDWHDRIRLDSDLRIALVRHPDFVKKVRTIVIECGSVTEQPTLDRYIRGESVPREQLARVWNATTETTNGFCDAPAYAEFLAAVRDVNSRLASNARVRLLGGHPGPHASRGIEDTAVSVLKAQLLQQPGKALIVPVALIVDCIG